MFQKSSRREFLQESAVVAAVAAMPGSALAANAGEFASRWGETPDRVWLGSEYWANPLQDWRVAGGRIECITAAANRNVHLLTRQLGEQPGDLAMSVKIGRVGGKLADGKGSAGFRIGIMGPLREYRSSLIYGQGLDAGFTSDGKLFIGNPASGVPVVLSGDSVELRLNVAPAGDKSSVSLSAHDASGKELGRATRDEIESASLAGNIALVANFGGGAGGGGGKAAKKGKAKAADGSAEASAGQFWFADWKVSGSRVEVHDERAFGPILFNQYTLSGGTLKMTAQMPPLGPKDAQTVRLELQRDGKWSQASESTIDPIARIATFRVEKWDDKREQSYRLIYGLNDKNGKSHEHVLVGKIRRDPIDQPVLTIGDVSCNTHEAFPNTNYTANMAKLNPDLLAFVGDQFYESSGGYGVQRGPLEPAILDYLRKWYLHGWTWRELTKDRPSISIPDDHDVYQGNNWGEGGAPQTTTQEAGGYNMPGAWVNVVHKTQTSHHPDPWDATPCKQGISVYSGPLVYGGISFAILADRQFKSGPEGKVPHTGSRGDHVVDPNWDPKTADVPGLQLLGADQMKHLKEWVRDWRGAEMKAVISQTIFTAMATHHGGEGRLVADYDTNGWPQSERNAALREMRKAFAFHIAGDQHLPAIVHYGIDDFNDAGIAFAGPAMNCGYPRWFEPLKPGANREAGAAENTGEFLDCFGHPMTVIAVADGAHQPRQPLLERLHDKVSGLGIVQFDKPKRKITIKCWPFLANVLEPGTEFRGWPRTFSMLENYGRKAVAYLPRLEVRGSKDPLVEVFDERGGELVYGLRPGSTSWQPFVFAVGNYTLRISEPETGKTQEIKGVAAQAANSSKLDVAL
ncbi:MAG TPA: alkaline phosphatase D family protein [Pirellulaceae bacterium]